MQLEVGHKAAFLVDPHVDRPPALTRCNLEAINSNSRCDALIKGKASSVPLSMQKMILSHLIFYPERISSIMNVAVDMWIVGDSEVFRMTVKALG